MKLSVVKLLFKKDDKLKIGNYRPISLLCSDYKILAKIMTERMKNVLKSVIGKDQQAFVKGGNIMGNLLLVKQIIAYCNEEDEEGAMILMDFAKAFDRINREALIAVLEEMNFGPNFISMVKTLYQKIEAQVEVNS